MVVGTKDFELIFVDYLKIIRTAESCQLPHCKSPHQIFDWVCFKIIP